MRRSSGRRVGLAASVSGERWGASGSSCALSPAALAWACRLPGAALADLVWDSDEDDGPPPTGVDPDGARPVAERLLCFTGPHVSVALEIRRGGSCDLRGRLVPPQPGTLGLQRTTGGLLELEVDDAGRFAFPDLLPGPARLVLRAPGGPIVATSWVLID